MSPGGKDPESARSAEQIDIKRLPIKIQKVLNKYDVDGDGTITAAEFVIAMEQHEATRDSLKRQKRIVFWTFAVIIPVLLVFVAVGFGVVYWAVEYAKEARNQKMEATIIVLLCMSCAASSPSPSPLSPPYPPPSPPTPPPPPQEKYCISPYMNIDICTCANTTGIHSVDQVDGTNGGNCQCNVTNIETYCDYTVDDRFVCDTNVDEVTLITSVSGASDQRQSTSMLNSYPATMKIAERFKKIFLRKNRKEYDKEYKGATKKLLSHDSNELEINCVDDALRLGISSIKCETTNPNTCKIMFEVDLHVIMYRLFEEFLEVQDKDSSVGFLNKRRLLQNDESCGDDMLCGDDGRLIELCQIEGNNLIFPGTFMDLSSCICDADQDCKCKFTVPDFLVNTPIQNRLNDALLKQDFDDFFGENDFIDTMPRYLYDFMPDNREVLFSNTRTCLADDANNEDFDSLHQVKTLNSCTCTNGDSAGSICTCDVPNIKDNIQLDTSEELPEGAILCPGFLTGQYCDCSGDCTNSEAWCSCDAAKAQTCCNTSR
ncbi:unnamed protein product [Bathycoccus prasinos]